MYASKIRSEQREKRGLRFDETFADVEGATFRCLLHKGDKTYITQRDISNASTQHKDIKRLYYDTHVLLL